MSSEPHCPYIFVELVAKAELVATIAKAARSQVYHTQLCCSVQPLFFLCSPQGKKCVSRDQRLEEFAGSCSLYLLWLLAGCSRQSDPVFRDSLCKFSLTCRCLLHISIILFLRASACFVFFPNYYLCVWCALAPCLMVLCCFLAFPSVSSESFVFCWVYTVNRCALLKKKVKTDGTGCRVAHLYSSVSLLSTERLLLKNHLESLNFLTKTSNVVDLKDVHAKLGDNVSFTLVSCVVHVSLGM